MILMLQLYNYYLGVNLDIYLGKHNYFFYKLFMLVLDR